MGYVKTQKELKFLWKELLENVWNTVSQMKMVMVVCGNDDGEECVNVNR